jgi:hypothetical protein
MKDNFLDLVPNRQPRRYSCWVCYNPNIRPLFPVQGRLYILAAVISVGEDKLPPRRTSQASRVIDPLERGTWSQEERVDSIVSGRIEFTIFLSCKLRAHQQK